MGGNGTKKEDVAKLKRKRGGWVSDGPASHMRMEEIGEGKQKFLRFGGGGSGGKEKK